MSSADDEAAARRGALAVDAYVDRFFGVEPNEAPLAPAASSQVVAGGCTNVSGATPSPTRTRRWTRT
jgi:hypothetical protein